MRTVIYDGDCGFCRRAVNRWKRLDWGGRLTFRARLEPGVAKDFPQVSLAQTEREVASVRPDGKFCGGFYAVRDIWRELPLLFVPSLFLYIPGVSLIGVPLYNWVARHRYLFSKGKKTCGIK